MSEMPVQPESGVLNDLYLMVNPNQESPDYPTNALLIGNRDQDDFGKINRIRFMSHYGRFCFRWNTTLDSGFQTLHKSFGNAAATHSATPLLSVWAPPITSDVSKFDYGVEPYLNLLGVQ